MRWLVLRQVLVLTGTGLAHRRRCVLAFTARLLEGLLFGVQPADPVTIALVAAVFGTVALAAAWVPALRATRVDPIRALEDGVGQPLIPNFQLPTPKENRANKGVKVNRISWLTVLYSVVRAVLLGTWELGVGSCRVNIMRICRRGATSQG